MAKKPADKEHFNTLVDALLARADSLLELTDTLMHFTTGTQERYQTAYDTSMTLVNDFKQFADEHPDVVDQLITSELRGVKADLNNMKELNDKGKSKDHAAKNRHFKSAIVNLRSDIRSMRLH